tara:strand:+ start:1025 stop:2884 length:1860 start_codon:yes stop_codon:yes gene_type:complete
METSPLDELLADALKQCAQDFPQAKQKLDAFNEALDRLEERDGHENLTRAAHDARQYLRSGLLDMRPYKRAKKEVGKQLRKAKARYEKSTATALAHKVVYHQWKIEYELLDDRDDGIKLVPRSREEHAQDSIARIAAPFVHAMIERGVTPSAISRGRASEADVIAQLIQSAYDDPQYEDPANPWVAIHRAGVFDAYRTGLTEDEARLLDVAQLRGNEEATEALRAAREFLPEGLAVSTGVALGAARLMRSLGSLSDGLAQAYADAHNLVRDKDAEQVGRFLGLETEGDLLKLQVLLNFLRVQSVASHPELPTWVEIDVMRRVVDNANAHVKPASEWVETVTQKLSNIAEIFGNRLNSEDGFYALLHAAMRSSYTFRHFESVAENRSSKDVELTRLRLLRGAVLEGKAFKIDQFGYPVVQGDEGYDEIESQAYLTVNVAGDHDDTIGPDCIAAVEAAASSARLLTSSQPCDTTSSEDVVRHPHVSPSPDEPGSDEDEDENEDEGEEVDFYALIAEAEDASDPQEGRDGLTGGDRAEVTPASDYVEKGGDADRSDLGASDEIEGAPPGTAVAQEPPCAASQDAPGTADEATESADRQDCAQGNPKGAVPLFGNEEEVWEDD